MVRSSIGRTPAGREPKRKSRSSTAASGGYPPPFRALQVLIPSSAPLGTLALALEATRALGEGGARVTIVLAPSGDAPSANNRTPAVAALLGRYRWVTSSSQGPETSERLLTLVASPYVCVDRAAVDRMMQEVWRCGAGAAVAPSLVGPDGRDLHGLSTSGTPLAWMAASQQLKLSVESLTCAADHPGAAAIAQGPLEFRRLQGVKLLVPRPGDVPRAPMGGKEFERLAT